MWILITRKNPPQPPQPQFPPTVALPANPTLQDKEDAVNDNHLAVSYCALLKDTSITTYDWVDQALRDEIYECMYHKPSDRPTLPQLLARAKVGAQKHFLGEDDGYIRRWIKKWL